ncbi:MAG: MATE family efflux transporter, partial [Firmicutes bacterium]|nr:MATE family efflux transporter [Bacillota bacterium]
MKQEANFTSGGIFLPLIRFSLPVLLALLLQAMYGAVDLWVVARFAAPADISGVSTGSQIMHTLTFVITGLAMGVTIQVGQLIGEGKPERAGKAIGAGVCMFAVLAAVLTAVLI